MGFFPTGSTKYRIMAIDPGSHDCGYCIIEYDVVDSSAYVITSDTLKTMKLPGYTSFAVEIHGDKHARLRAMEDELYFIMRGYSVHRVASETPYLGRLPQAFGALVECLYAITNAMLRHCYDQSLTRVTPSQAKNSVGVAGNSGDKDKVREGILGEIEKGRLTSGVEIGALDEHAVDSIAVGYSLVQGWRNGFE